MVVWQGPRAGGQLYGAAAAAQPEETAGRIDTHRVHELVYFRDVEDVYHFGHSLFR